jgi:hypothetical protein
MLYGPRADQVRIGHYSQAHPMKDSQRKTTLTEETRRLRFLTTICCFGLTGQLGARIQ